MANQPVAEACAEAALDFMQQMTRFLISEGRQLDPDVRITPPQFRALALVERSPGLSLSELAGQLGIRTPTASIILVRLVQGGLVKRSSAGGRRLALELTKKGVKQLGSTRQHMEEKLADAFAKLPAAQLKQILESLEKTNATIERTL